MLIPQDNNIGHQMPTSFAFNGTSDPAWMERYWYTAHLVPSGDVMLNIGMGLHPNRNVMDGHAGITIGSKQYSFCASRHLGRDPLTSKIGPLQFEVLDGMRRNRITLDTNESGLTFDIEFIADKHPHEEETRLVRRHGRVSEHLMRYQQVGRYSGWVKFRGERYELTPETWWGQRDHSWGIRSPMRSDATHPPVAKFPPHLFTWCVAQFDDYALQMFMMDKEPGKFIYLSGEQVLPQDSKPDHGLKIVNVVHDIEWVKDEFQCQTASAIKWDFTFANGDTKTLTARPLPARFFLKGGLYGGVNGWFQGDDKGNYHSESFDWDLCDPKTREMTRTLCDNVMEYTDGDNIGYGICEYWAVEGYKKYAEVQHIAVP